MTPRPLHPLLEFKNPVRAALLDGKTSIGIFLVSASALAAECCATRSINWLMIDMEASPAERRELTQVLQALNGSTAMGMVRVARNERQLIEAALDAGARGILVPKIESGEQAARVVESAYYPPKGRRGVNPIRCSGYFSALPDYFKCANDMLLLMVQIESASGVEKLDEIASTDGIDMLFVGCGDLACDLGYPGNVEGAHMEKPVARVLEACRKHKKIPGIFAYSVDLARKYARQGFQFIAIGNDLKFLASGLEDCLSAFRME